MATRWHWPARELVRVAVVVGRAQTHDLQKLAGLLDPFQAVADPVVVELDRDILAHGHARIERRQRVLKDDLHLAPEPS